MSTKFARTRLIRSVVTVFALLVASLSFSVGQASADNPIIGFEIQNQATGLCIQGTPDYGANAITARPCGTSPDQYFANHTTQLVDFANFTNGAYAICLAADSYTDALSVSCTNTSYGLDWTYASLNGDWTTVSNQKKGCYLKIVGVNTVACMPGFQGSEAQWRLTRATPPHHAGTEDGSTGRVRYADFDGDGKADYWIINPDGSVRVFLNKGGDGNGGWQDQGQIAQGLTTDRSRVRFADFDGDGRADYILINPDGTVRVYLNKGSGNWQDIGIVAQGLTTDASRVRFADIDGDGKADYCLIGDDGGVTAYLNRGGDTSGGWVNDGKIAAGATTDLSRIRLADIDGDGRADYSVINPDGSLTTYINRGGDGHGGWYNAGQLAAGTTTNQNAITLTDFTGDGMADWLMTNPDGSVNAYRNDDANGHWTSLGRIAAGA
ncbi:FG-GAP-like repeat-containing protein [Kitasatospora sp. NPDC017646]|uniref:FG-GAP-like repeat-containing protein n=1 Tax=Kitasatospora sp. NPDC017646 TaxID=3364024 RepID=UPI00379E45F5